MSTYDNIFFKHFYENFDFEKCSLVVDSKNRLVELTDKFYTIELYDACSTCEYTFHIKDKKVSVYYSPKMNTYAEKLIFKVISIREKVFRKIEEKKIMELNKFLESIHS